MSKRVGICPKCFKVGSNLTDHHVYPSRWSKSNGDTKLYLCWDCHREIEDLLPLHKKLTKESCLKITEAWLRGRL